MVDSVGMGHERRDVNLIQVVEVLHEAAAAGDLRHLHHLLADDVVLHSASSHRATPSHAQEWAHGRWRWRDRDGGDGGRALHRRAPQALFLTADDGRAVPHHPRG